MFIKTSSFKYLKTCDKMLVSIGCIPCLFLGGRNAVNNTPGVSFSEAEFYYPDVEGGHWSPPHCVARDRVAVIIPFRDRESHLPVLLKYLHRHLQKQLIEYSVFVIEQVHRYRKLGGGQEIRGTPGHS